MLFGGTEGIAAVGQPDHSGRNTISVGMLVGRYLAEELPERYSTGRSYRSYIEKWVEPKWKEYALAEVRSLAVEQWLAALPLAPKSRRHLRGITRVIFQCAVRWELVSRNPIDLVRVNQSDADSAGLATRTVRAGTLRTQSAVPNDGSDCRRFWFARSAKS